MLCLQRPTKPTSFDKKVERYRKQAKAAFEAPGGVGQPVLSTRFKFRPAWSQYKDQFILAQNGRCGYCEGPITGVSVGAVEHFRPKAEVCTLSDEPTEWGQENAAGRLTGRRPAVVCGTGYWWLAYEWGNYLFACETCNSTYKGSLFPVAENPRLAPSQGLNEHVLLLNPFDGPDPAEHLLFRPDGAVEPFSGSLLGKETIKTCGLNRAWLRTYRRPNAQRAYELARELLNAGSDNERDRTLMEWHELGSVNPGRLFGFPGMIRVIFVQMCGLPWEIAEEFAKGKGGQGTA